MARLLLASVLVLSLLVPFISADDGMYKCGGGKDDADCSKQCLEDKACASYKFDAAGTLAKKYGKGGDTKCFFYNTAAGGKGEPHFHGADGSNFDFSGVPDTTYTLFTDAHLQVNAFFGGRFGQWGEDSRHSITWMRKVAILHGHHSLVLEAREGAEWAYGNGYMQRMSFDGEDFTLSQEGDAAELADGVRVSWVAAKEKSVDDLVDVYEVEIPNVLNLQLTLRPEVEVLRTAEDGTVHFDINVRSVRLSNSAHGILGQTFRADHAGRFEKTPQVWSELLHSFMVAAQDGEGFLDGKAADYATSALLKADSAVSRFVRAKEIDEELAGLAQAMSSSSSFLEARRRTIRLARKLLNMPQ